MIKVYEFTAGPEDDGLQVKKVIKRRYGFSSRVMTAIKYRGSVKIDGKDALGWFPLAEGDFVTVSLPDEESHFTPEKIKITPLYEDDDLLIIDKQPGIAVHPTRFNTDYTIANGLMQYMIDTGESFKIRFINRLDKDTSGVLAIAKNANTQEQISRQMRAGTTEKRYYAVVSGIVEKDSFTIDLPIGRPSHDSINRAVMSIDEGGAPSKTEVSVLKRFPGPEIPICQESPESTGATLLELRLLTGRTHQIRVHLSYIGHPLIGDWRYGGDMSFFTRQALHAYHFECDHPTTKERLVVEADIPEDMRELIEKLKVRK